jgi:hypothetical protein
MSSDRDPLGQPFRQAAILGNCVVLAQRSGGSETVPLVSRYEPASHAAGTAVGRNAHAKRGRPLSSAMKGFAPTAHARKMLQSPENED